MPWKAATAAADISHSCNNMLEWPATTDVSRTKEGLR
jgi:hypothetical protein